VEYLNFFIIPPLKKVSPAERQVFIKYNILLFLGKGKGGGVQKGATKNNGKLGS
jgi:hypothetical protein